MKQRNPMNMVTGELIRKASYALDNLENMGMDTVHPYQVNTIPVTQLRVLENLDIIRLIEIDDQVFAIRC